jgi:hypothetical protein
LFSKKLGPQKIWSQKNLVPEKFGSKKVGPRKIVPKKVGAKNWSKKLGSLGGAWTASAREGGGDMGSVSVAWATSVQPGYGQHWHRRDMGSIMTRCKKVSLHFRRSWPTVRRRIIILFRENSLELILILCTCLSY